MTTKIKKENKQNEFNFLLRKNLYQFIENLKIFLSKKLNMFSFSLVMFLIFIAIFSPILSPHQFDQVNPSNALAPPSLEHFMGTDTT
jgi:ABC-type antimicrobial peptide transport system permease subunit